MKTETISIRELLNSLLAHYQYRLDSYQKISFEMRNWLAISQPDNLHALELIKKFDELAACPNPHHLVKIVIDSK